MTTTVKASAPTKKKAAPKAASKKTTTAKKAPAKKATKKAAPKDKKDIVVLCEMKLADLDFDVDYQMRVDIPNVDLYKALIEQVPTAFGWPFRGEFDGAIRVVTVKGKHKVVDGFTRGLAAQAAGRTVVPVAITEGSALDAFRLSQAANLDHGFALTIRDKRRKVAMALGRWPKFAANRIATECGLSAPFVRSVIADFKQVSEEDLTDEELAEAVVSGKARRARLAAEAKSAEDEEKPNQQAPAGKVLKKKPKPNPAPPEMDDTEQLGPCPNCSADLWIEKEGESGSFCKVCDQVYGEPVGDVDEPEDFEAPASELKEASPVKKAEPTPDQVVDVTKVAGDKARSAVGTLTRSLEDLGLLQGYRAVLNEILDSIAKKEAGK